MAWAEPKRKTMGSNNGGGCPLSEAGHQVSHGARCLPEALSRGCPAPWAARPRCGAVRAAVRGSGSGGAGAALAAAADLHWRQRGPEVSAAGRCIGSAGAGAARGEPGRGWRGGRGAEGPRPPPRNINNNKVSAARGTAAAGSQAFPCWGMQTPRPREPELSPLQPLPPGWDARIVLLLLLALFDFSRPFFFLFFNFSLFAVSHHFSAQKTDRIMEALWCVRPPRRLPPRLREALRAVPRPPRGLPAARPAPAPRRWAGMPLRRPESPAAAWRGALPSFRRREPECHPRGGRPPARDRGGAGRAQRGVRSAARSPGRPGGSRSSLVFFNKSLIFGGFFWPQSTPHSAPPAQRSAERDREEWARTRRWGAAPGAVPG